MVAIIIRIRQENREARPQTGRRPVTRHGRVCEEPVPVGSNRSKSSAVSFTSDDERVTPPSKTLSNSFPSFVLLDDETVSIFYPRKRWLQPKPVQSTREGTTWETFFGILFHILGFSFLKNDGISRVSSVHQGHQRTRRKCRADWSRPLPFVYK